MQTLWNESSKSNSKQKVNYLTQRNSPPKYTTPDNEKLLKMSKFKRYQPPIRKKNKPKLNSSSNNSTMINKGNNTAIGNECLASKNILTFLPDKIDTKLGLNEEIFNDENILLTDLNFDNQLGINPLFKDEKMSYEEWNLIKQQNKIEPIRKINLKKKPYSRFGNQNYLQITNLPRNSYDNKFGTNFDTHKAFGTKIRNEERHKTLNASKNEQKKIIKTIKDKISQSNNINQSSFSTNYNGDTSQITFHSDSKSQLDICNPIMQYLKKTAGDNFEKFDENCNYYLTLF